MPNSEGLIVDSKGTFKSVNEIAYESIKKEEPIFHNGERKDITFDDMLNEAIRRRDCKLEFEGMPDFAKVEIPTTTPIVIGCFGDPHLDGLYVDYELIREHTNEISRNPKMYSLVGGDLVEGAAFNPAQDSKIGSFSEESAFAIKMLDKMNGSILAMCMGDHDAWAEREGITIYNAMRERYKAPILRGSSSVSVKVGEVEYLIVMAHRLLGNSIYNKTHPENRESKFGQQGADAYIGWHTHQKGIAQQVARQADGNDLLQTFVSSGPYQYSSKYAQKLGFGQQREKDLGAVWLVLHPYRKEIEAFWSMESAKERIEPYLTGKLHESKPSEPIDIIKEIAK